MTKETLIKKEEADGFAKPATVPVAPAPKP